MATLKESLTLSYFISHKWGVAILICLLAIIFGWVISDRALFRMLELKSIDSRFEIRGGVDQDKSNIVIVDISDQASAALPERWPWPREYYARLIRNLNQAGAKSIGIDVVLDMPDINNPQSDDELARVLKETNNVVLAGKILEERKEGGYHYRTLIEPYEIFNRAIQGGWGMVSVAPDMDGSWRRYLMIDQYKNRTYYGFAIEVLLKYFDYHETIKIQLSEIPQFSKNYMLINFQGAKKTFPYYSFDTVIDDSTFMTNEEDADFKINSFDARPEPDIGFDGGLLYQGIFKDKIVLVGSSMAELHDLFPSPFSTELDLMPGVEIHANALHTLLNQDYIYRQTVFKKAVMIIMLTVLAFLMTSYLKPFAGFIFINVEIGLLIILSIYLFSYFNYLIYLVSPILSISFCFVGNVMFQYSRELEQKRLIKHAFKHYLDKNVVEHLIHHPELLQLGGEERHMTVLFSDIEGFTSVSEKLTPSELVELLNEYLTEMTEIILNHKGIIDKYEGDAIMAEFGAPIHYEDHAYQACLAALDMEKRLRELRLKWRREGKPELKARIGVNTGAMVVGNMGSRNVFNYTVMGDSVNVGSRLEGANKFYGTYIMISDATYQEVKHKMVARPLGLLRVKGKLYPIQVYELIATKSDRIGPDKTRVLQEFQIGLQAYQHQEWDKGVDIFQKILDRCPTDGPSAVYLERCLSFKYRPPAPNWDGVYVMKTK
ncbi:MAG: hypothetical protein B6244_10350 [Candidatus Cloacimonetes bacterium 4572_55]|nr:MAG: hypothetical protein B6244_10350 [Candidatus Cloacimonetes bacterium 4572_55]